MPPSSKLPAPDTLPDDLAAALAAEVARREPAALDLLRDLIRTPSVTGGEGRHDQPGTVAHRLWRALGAESGLERHADPVAPDRDNLLGVIRGAADTPVVLLDAHTDTVPAGDPARWLDADPFSARDGLVHYLGENRIRLEIGDHALERPVRPRLGRLWEARSYRSAPILYGRGAFDNKGPVAVAVLATQALAGALSATGRRLRGTLVCALVVDEEAAMAGTHALAGAAGRGWVERHDLLPAGFGPDGFRSGIWGVALDGSYGFVPVVGHRGVAQFLVRTRGQAAHAATPDLGVNAVTRMAAVLHALDAQREALAARLAPLFADDLLEPASLALGTTIAGGGVIAVDHGADGATVERGGINVVPDWCQATIDCRYPRPADGDLASIPSRIAAAIRDFALERTALPGDDLAVDRLSGSPPCAILPSAAAGDDRLVGAVLHHGAVVSGFAPWVETAPGGTDATVLINEGRIKTLVEFGPAGALAHEPHECVERDQIAAGALILARVVADLLGTEPLPPLPEATRRGRPPRATQPGLGCLRPGSRWHIAGEERVVLGGGSESGATSVGRASSPRQPRQVAPAGSTRGRRSSVRGRNPVKEQLIFGLDLEDSTSRRRLLRTTAGSALGLAALVVLSACNDEDENGEEIEDVGGDVEEGIEDVGGELEGAGDALEDEAGGVLDEEGTLGEEDEEE